MRPTDPQIGEQYFRAAVSGSFHRHMHLISASVRELASLSVRVLSPTDPRVVAQQGEFLFVASDRVRSVRLVQDRHMEAIRAADFLWLICPDGYVGLSASMEVGFAAAANVPVFSTHAPCDLTLRQYVTIVPTVTEALGRVAANSRSRHQEGILIDPHASVEEAHHILDRVESLLICSHGLDEPTRLLKHEMADLGNTLRMPVYAQ